MYGIKSSNQPRASGFLEWQTSVFFSRNSSLVVVVDIVMCFCNKMYNDSQNRLGGTRAPPERVTCKIKFQLISFSGIDL